MTLYYQVDYLLTEIPANAAYFHAQFRWVNPLPYLAWGVHNNSWWGEGEIKFYMDGDKDWPTICETGTEDYFCGSYDFDTHS